MGVFSGTGGSGSLHFLPLKTPVNGDRHISMLEDQLIFWMKHHGASHFLLDGAPCHTNKNVMAFLKEKKISVMDCLGNLPDLQHTQSRICGLL
jgi:hypothetical protein